MRAQKWLKQTLLELIKDIFYLFAGGLGAQIFVEGILTQTYYLCGCSIVLFFVLFWRTLFDIIDIENEKRTKNEK